MSVASLVGAIGTREREWLCSVRRYEGIVDRWELPGVQVEKVAWDASAPFYALVASDDGERIFKQ